MATQETIGEVVKMLFRSPLANKPKPLPGEPAADAIKNTTRIYYLALQDIDDDLLMAATVHHIATEKWFPAVADLRAAAVTLMRRAGDAPDPYTAWGQIKRWLRGGSEPHPMAVRAINALGGLKEYGQSQVDDEGQWRARFISAYETYQRREAEDAMTLPAVRDYIDRQRIAAEIRQLAASRSLDQAFDRTPPNAVLGQPKELTNA
jgi:hypothetical protein